MKYQKLVPIVGLLIVLTSPMLAVAQIEPAQEDETEARLKKMEETLKAQNEKIEQLEKQESELEEKQKQTAEQNEELRSEVESTKEELEMISMMGMEDDSGEKRLSIYGFFDVSFYKSFFEYEDSVLKALDAPYGTFVMNNINLFLKSEMTDSLEALIETRLSFGPNGEETNLPVDAYVDGELYPDLIDDTEYERTDTTVSSTISGEEFKHGSIDIVRAYLDWKPRDWFSARAGRYLTPFGIWNVEHASTVLVGIFYPSLMNQRVVPLSQMGLQFYGSTFIGELMKLDYAVTLSNGRGPVDTLMDLDENKAIGARAQATWSGENWNLKIGGYGYFGKYTDASRRAVVNLTAGPTGIEIDDESGSATSAVIQVEEEYNEMIGTADLSLELWGVKLFGEYVFKRVNYIKAPIQIRDNQFIQNGDIVDTRYEPSFTTQSVYGILAWTLPLDKFIAPVTITPYGGYDWVQIQDHFDWYAVRITRFGLNVKPSPHIVLKLEGVVDALHRKLGGTVNILTAQIAVSF
ncbi:MAG: hypothetical protein GY854_09340 [Deltaproteobacteria bacterium]|nr:hypothetical protein [Deltaproteobacteria bacterium]